MKSLQALMMTILITAGSLVTAGSLAATGAAAAADRPLAAQPGEAALQAPDPAHRATPAAPKARTVRKSTKITLLREPCVPPDPIPGGDESDASIEDQGAEQGSKEGARQATKQAQAKVSASLGGKRPAPLRRVFCVCISSPDKCAQYQEKQIKPAF